MTDRSIAISKLDRTPDFKAGYRLASRRAVEWLHNRAAQMNDEHAVQVLQSAATNLGWAFADEATAEAHSQAVLPSRSAP